MTLDAIEMMAPIWLEMRNKTKYLYTGWALAYDRQTGEGITGERMGMADPSGRVHWWRVDDYGKNWRCWNGKPIDEQRQAVKWE